MSRTTKKALITGVTGQDGAYLSRFLLGKGYEVVGLVRRNSTPNLERLERLGIDDRVKLVEGDLGDQLSIVNALKEELPDEFYNLAAQSFVPESWKTPAQTGEVTGLGVTRCLDAIRVVDPGIRFYQASSSEMFGKVAQVPQCETTPFYPRSPYGVAKVYGYWITVNYRESYGTYTCNGILFNHESPLRGPEFLSRKVTRAVAKIALGLDTKLALGNLEAQRDWGFAGDYVEAMWLMLQQDEPDDYVISANETHSVRELVDIAFKRIGIDDWSDHVVVDPALHRPAEVDLLLGDSTKARERLGWTPRLGFRELIEVMVDADLEWERRKLMSGRLEAPMEAAALAVAYA
jgi:GDPmannose 4,6-dehydratase